MKIHLMTATLIGIGLSGCGKAEPRSQIYFEAHGDEARNIVEKCRDGSVRSEECANAARAVSRIEAKERAKRFLGDGKAYTPN